MDSNQPGWVFKPGDLPPQEDGASAQPANLTPEVPPVNSEPSAPELSAAASGAHVEWTASEYIANPKSSGWFMVLVLATIVLTGIAYIVTRDFVPTVVIAIVGILFGVFAARQPRTLHYAVDNRGIHIGEKFYPYAMFKSFSVAHDHAIAYISLLPLKRFMPPLSIHYAQEDEASIAGTLAEYLPYEDHHTDIMDNIAKKIRF